jgi:hypothetical protein
MQSILRKIAAHSSQKCNAIFARLETKVLMAGYQWFSEALERFGKIK